MEKDPLLSIIVPVYNVEKYLERCLNSLINQQIKNIEIIIVNDGSPDNSEKIIEKFINTDSRIIYLKKDNGGLSDARNFGIKAAKGKYIGFVDSDDYINKNMYIKMLEIAEKENHDMVICGFKHIYENGEIREEINFNNGNLYEILKYSYSWNKIYKKELFKGMKFPKDKHYEDMFIIPQLAILSKKIGVIKESLYFYMIREGSITTRRDNPKLLDFLEACNNNKDYLFENNLMKLYEDEWQDYRQIIKTSFYKTFDNYSINYKIKNLKKILYYYSKLEIDKKYDIFRILFSMIYPKYYIKKIVKKFL